MVMSSSSKIVLLGRSRSRSPLEWRSRSDVRESSRSISSSASTRRLLAAVPAGLANPSLPSSIPEAMTVTLILSESAGSMMTPNIS